MKNRILWVCILFAIGLSNSFSQTLSFTQSAAARGVAMDAGLKDGGTVLADINRDGHLDLVVNTQNNNATHGRTRIFLNDGSGNFSDVTSARAPAMLNRFRERQVIVADLNNDGHVDIVRTTGATIDGGGPAGEIYFQHPTTGIFGDGVGGSTPIGFGNSGITIAGTVNMEGVSFFDYDGDGDLDLFVENHTAGVKILRNNLINHVTGLRATPTPAFSAMFTNITTATSGTQFGLQMSGALDGDYMASGDFNNDGWIDLLVRKNGAGNFDIYRNLGTGNFTGTFIANTNNSDKGGVAFYDLNNDGFLDVVWTSAGGNFIGRNNGDNTFTWLTGASSPFNTALAGFSSQANVDGVAGGDFDNDGDIDLILSGDLRSYIFINNLNAPGAPNSGTPLTFTLLASFNSDAQNSGNGEGITTGDIDGDGDLDIYQNIRSGTNRLWINNLYNSSTPLADKDYLSLYVFENRSPRMAAGEERYSLNATILIKDVNGNILGPALNVNQTRGHGCQDGGPAHIGLPFGRDYTYVFEAYFPNDAVNFVVTDRPVISKKVNPHELGITALAFRPGTGPTAISDFGITFVNQNLTGNLLWNDRSNFQAVEVNTTPVSGPTNGVLTLGSDGTYSYTPNTGFTGTDQFTYQMCYDATSAPQLCDLATVFISVIPIPSLTLNNPPIASVDHFTTPINTSRTGSLVANDMDPDGDPLTIQTTPLVLPSHGTITINPDGTFLYNPTASFVGKDSLQYQICDNGSPALCHASWAYFTILPLPKYPDNNLPPSAADDFYFLQEDDTLAGNLLLNDQDNAHSISISTTPLNLPEFGQLTINSDGTFSYIPRRNFWGTDQFSYKVCDGATPSLCDSARVVIQVNPINDAPYLLPSLYYTYTGEVVKGNVLVNALDVEADTLDLTIAPVVGPTNGTLNFSLDGSFSYLPNVGFTGTETIHFEVCDRGTPNMCEQSILTIQAGSIPDPTLNSPPAPMDDDYYGYVNQVLTGSVLLNDQDPDGDNLAVTPTLLASPTHGLVVFNPDGTFTYTPNTGYIGSDSFEYEVCDDGTPSLCTPAKVHLSILPVPPRTGTNRPPLLTNDFFMTNEELAVSGDVSDNDRDPDTHPLTFSLLSPPDNANLVFNTDGTFTYSPSPNVYGPDYFVYEACDNQVPPLCRKGTAHFLVRPINDPPLAIADYNLTFMDMLVSGNVRINDKHPDQLPLTVTTTLVSGPSDGLLVLAANGDYTYTPNAGFTGNDVAVYQVCDGRTPALCSTAEIHLTVQPLFNSAANNPPVAAPDVRFTQVNQPLSANVTENDFDMDGHLLTVNSTPVTNVTHGTLSLLADGSFTYTPNPSFSGTDAFVYEVCDNGTPSLCSQATAMIVVGWDSLGTPNNKAPFAADLFFLANESTPVSADVSVNDLEPDGQTMVYETVLIRQPARGRASLLANGTFSYTPEQFYVGPDQFSYLVCDGQNPAKCDSATVYFLVRKDNNPPLPIPDINQTFVDEDVTGNVLANDRDPDGGNLSVTTTPVRLPSHGSVVLSANGDYTFTPDPGFHGRDAFVYEVCNDGIPAKCTEERVTIIVYEPPFPGDNNPPLPNDDAFVTLVGQPFTGSVLSNDFDPDAGDTITISLISPPEFHSGAFTLSPSTGAFTYTPQPGFWGLDSLVYRVCDNQSPSLCDSAVVYVRVIGSASSLPLQVLARDNFYFGASDNLRTGNVLEDDFDLGGRPLNATTTLITPPNNGTVTMAANGNFSYDPAPGFSGADFFTYEVCNNGSPSECANASAFFLFGGFPVPLPVTLISFQAIPRFPQVDVVWKTLAEVNNRAFLLYKSKDAVHWSWLAEIPGSGTTNTPNHYQYIDQEVSPGTIYYKLIQEDFDGTQTQEGIAVVHYEQPLAPHGFFPNPVAIGSMLQFVGSATNEEVIFLDVSGREVVRITLKDASVQMVPSYFSPGIYFVKTNAGTQRLVVY